MPRRMIDCDTLGARRAAQDRARHGADDQRDREPEVEPVSQDVGDRGGQHQRHRLHQVGADQLHRRQRGVEHEQRDHDDRAGAHRGDTDQQAPDGADGDGREGPDLHLAVVGLETSTHGAQVDVEAQRVGGGREQQGEADADLQHVVDLVGIDDGLDEEGPQEGHRHRPDDQPLGHLEVRRAVARVHHCAAGLVDRRRGQVGGDDGLGVAHAEEDQRRGHQGAAAHAGQTDHDADGERRDGDAEELGHVVAPGVSARSPDGWGR